MPRAMPVVLSVYGGLGLGLPPIKSHGRRQWCCLRTEAVSCCGGCVVQQYMKHVLRSMCVLVKSFVAQVLYSNRRNVYIFTNAIKTNSEVVEMFTYLQTLYNTAAAAANRLPPRTPTLQSHKKKEI